MIQPPKSTKYRKYQRNYQKMKQSTGSVRKTRIFSQKYPGGPHNASKLARKHNFVAFGSYGLQCNHPTSVSLQQLETCRRLLRRVIQRQAPVWIRAFPHKPLYKQDQGHRIGKGKGERYKWVCPIRQGQILFEVGNQVDITLVRQVFAKIGFQLGVPTQLVVSNVSLLRGPSKR